MPQHQSAKKRVRQTKARTALNRSQESSARSAVKKMRTAISQGKKEEALKVLPLVQSRLALLAKKGIIKPNTAARKASRLAIQANRLA